MIQGVSTAFSLSIHISKSTDVHIELATRSSVENTAKCTVIGDETESEDATGVGCEVIMPQFSFMPLNRQYSYISSGVLSRTMVVVEVNLPSGVGPGMFDVAVVSGGAVLEITVEWPEYLLDPLMFNAQWLSGSGDGSLHHTSARITSSQKAAQDVQRSFGSTNVKSTARIALVQQVDEDVVNIGITQLGFVDDKKVDVKANGLALVVKMIAVEDFTVEMANKKKVSSFTPVKTRSRKEVTDGAAGSGVCDL